MRGEYVRVQTERHTGRVKSVSSSYRVVHLHKHDNTNRYMRTEPAADSQPWKRS